MSKNLSNDCCGGGGGTQGPQGLTGPQGVTGPQGNTGATGPQGGTGTSGSAATITVGTTTTLVAGSSATVTNSGNAVNSILNFGLVTGNTGPQGPAGVSPPLGFTNCFFNHVMSTSLSGVASTMTVSNSGFGLMAVLNGPGVPALNDTFRTIDFQILPGTYTFSFVASRLSNRGLVTWYLDGVTLIGTNDLYLNGSDSVILSIPSVVIPSSTNNSHYLTGVVTKNASSSGYFVYISLLWIK